MGFKRGLMINWKILVLLLVLLVLIVITGIIIGPKDKETAQLNEQVKMVGSITVQEGDQLLRDIVPEITTVFGLDKEEVLFQLSSPGNSPLIPTDVESWRKLEGLIIPGKYEIPEGRTLKEQLGIWLKDSEKRLVEVEKEIVGGNKLSVREQLVLASLVEAECLGRNYHDKIAEVFLNRINEGSKLQSCVTVEYPLGFQRPYLLFADVEVDSAYNTYLNDGLPPGPICAISTASLRAAMKEQPVSQLRYFFFDYVLGEMFFYEDYLLFKKDGDISGERFKTEQSLSRHDKINKQILYRK